MAEAIYARALHYLWQGLLLYLSRDGFSSQPLKLSCTIIDVLPYIVMFSNNQFGSNNMTTTNRHYCV